jgi:hypothetical protein
VFVEHFAVAADSAEVARKKKMTKPMVLQTWIDCASFDSVVVAAADADSDENLTKMMMMSMKMMRERFPKSILTMALRMSTTKFAASQMMNMAMKKAYSMMMMAKRHGVEELRNKSSGNKNNGKTCEVLQVG